MIERLDASAHDVIIDILAERLGIHALAMLAQTCRAYYALALTTAREHGLSRLYSAIWPNRLHVSRNSRLLWERVIVCPSWMTDASTMAPCRLDNAAALAAMAELQSALDERMHVDLTLKTIPGAGNGKATSSWIVEASWHLRQQSARIFANMTVGHTLYEPLARIRAEVSAEDATFGISHADALPRRHALAHTEICLGADPFSAREGAPMPVLTLAKIMQWPPETVDLDVTVETRCDGSVFMQCVPSPLAEAAPQDDGGGSQLTAPSARRRNDREERYAQSIRAHPTWMAVRIVPSEQMRSALWLQSRLVQAAQAL